MKINLLLKQLLALILVFSAGLFAGLYIKKDKPSFCSINTIRAGKYEFVNPLLICNIKEEQDFPEFASLKSDIQNFANNTAKLYSADSVSVYFRDYSAGQWLNINGNEKYTPASLLKVPLMTAYLSLAENNPNLLQKTISYDGSFDLVASQYFKPAKVLEKGKTYTVEELLQRMIIYSDNNATELLAGDIDDAILKKIYDDLGFKLSPKPVNAPQDFITPEQYALFFRLLYNATYLNAAMSEKALFWLSQSDFDKGITASTPENIKVSNKFGEALNQKGEKELHDCGIIYYPNNPYLLCVMTKGTNIDNLSLVIRDISRFVFDYVNNKYQNML